MQLEPVTTDTFIADLDSGSVEGEARLAAFVESLAVSPRRRIYD